MCWLSSPSERRHRLLCYIGHSIFYVQRGYQGGQIRQWIRHQGCQVATEHKWWLILATIKYENICARLKFLESTLVADLVKKPLRNYATKYSIQFTWVSHSPFVAVLQRISIHDAVYWQALERHREQQFCNKFSSCGSSRCNRSVPFTSGKYDDEIGIPMKLTNGAPG